MNERNDCKNEWKCADISEHGKRACRGCVEYVGEQDHDVEVIIDETNETLHFESLSHVARHFGVDASLLYKKARCASEFTHCFHLSIPTHIKIGGIR